MFIGKGPDIAIPLVCLGLSWGLGVGFAQTGPVEQPSPEAVAKLIAQLNAPQLRTRQEASAALEKLGSPVLPALRKAATASAELEARRRIELVVGRIENAVLKAEEDRWQGLGAPRRSIKDRLVKILARTPAPSDEQVASVVYLLGVGRAPTDEEMAQAQKQLAGTIGRPTSALLLSRSLVQSKEFSAKVAAANSRLFKVQRGLSAEKERGKVLARLNGEEFQKITGDIGPLLEKAVKSDEQLVRVAFLLMLSRFPTATDSQTALAHLKNATNRPTWATDVVWALMNTKEFLEAP